MQTTQSSKRRSWRFLVPRHATVVAYAALIVALGGTAVAATGGTFILGHSNTAAATSALANTGKGPALSLKTSSSRYAPLAVSSNHLVSNLNADYLDGIHGSGYLALGTKSTSTATTTLSGKKGTPLSLTAPSGKAPLKVSNTVQVPNLNASLLDGLPASSLGGVETASVSVPASTNPVLQVVYGPVSGVSAATTTQTSADTLTPDVALVPSDLSVQVSPAPTTGGIYKVVVILSVNDGTAVDACEIDAPATTCSAPGAAISIPPGSRISLQILLYGPVTPGEAPAETVMVGFMLAPA